MGATTAGDTREIGGMRERMTFSLDEKMGQTYVHYECANKLAQRDYKQPQAVIYEVGRNDSRPSYSED